MIIDKQDASSTPDYTGYPDEKARPPAAASSRAYPPSDDLPPPYEGPSSSRGQEPLPEPRPEPRPEPPRGNSHLQLATQQEVNYFELESKHLPVSGSFVLNCELPPIQPLRKWKPSVLDSDNKKLLSQRSEPPNAYVYTRQGAVTLNLATAGRTNELSKAHVQLYTRQGKVHVNVHSLQLNKHICIEAYTRQGDMTLFVPHNFTGALQLRTRHGTIRFLPEFEQRARLVSAPGNSALVLFGQGVHTASFNLNDLSADSCLFSTRQGDITLGVSGMDPYNNVEAPGLLERLGSLSTTVLGRDVTTRLRMGLDAMAPMPDSRSHLTGSTSTPNK